jgi:hypothetical protein
MRAFCFNRPCRLKFLFSIFGLCGASRLFGMEVSLSNYLTQIVSCRTLLCALCTIIRVTPAFLWLKCRTPEFSV